MAAFTFFFHPMSRAQIARWAFHEVKADYEPVLVDWANKPAALLEANPMGKLPTIIHHHGGHDHVVTEAAAVCHYLAATHPQAGLLPGEHEMADYFRWLFFAAGPLEAAISDKVLGLVVPPERERMVGYGTLKDTLDALDGALSAGDYLTGDGFTAADLYVGAFLGFHLMFGTVEKRPVFERFATRLAQRPAAVRAAELDDALAAELQKKA